MSWGGWVGLPQRTRGTVGIGAEAIEKQGMAARDGKGTLDRNSGLCRSGVDLGKL